MNILRRCCHRVLIGSIIAVTSISATEPRESRHSIELTSANLDAVVGRYQLSSKQTLTVSRFRNQLFAKMPPFVPYAIYPDSETVFRFDGDAEGRLTFEKDDHGKVIAVRYDGSKTHVTGRKFSDLPYDPAEAPEIFDSPRLAALAKQLDAKAPGAMEDLWAEVQDRAPLIEPFPNDSHSSWVTFLYRGDAKTRAVRMRGGPYADSDDGRGMNFTRLRDTDLWYRTVRVPNDARFPYIYYVNLSGRTPDDPAAEQKLYDANCRADALNSSFIAGTGGMRPAFSLLTMPQAPVQPYVHAVAGIPRGRITHHEIKSNVLKQTRTYALYTPPNYDDKGEPLPLVVMFDGSVYYSDNFIPGPTIVDNLIAAKKIPPIMLAFVNQRDRQNELGCSKDFVAFIATELVPHVRGERHVTSDPKHTAIGGLSRGGLMASYCALQHPDVFGNVISQSGSYWYYPQSDNSTLPVSPPGGTLTNEFLKSPRLPVHFYLEAGAFENDLPGDLLAENRRFRDVLRAKGYDVTYSEFPGNHSFISWRGSFSDALICVTK